MSQHYWSYALSAAVYLINCMPSPITGMQSPYQKIFTQAPNYTKLRTFGCLCFPWLRPYTSYKLENRSTPCVFLGYSQTQSAYLCLQPGTGRIYISRHVQFDENSFPFRQSPPTQSPAKPNTNPTAHAVTTIPVQAPLDRSPTASQGIPSQDPLLNVQVEEGNNDDNGKTQTTLPPPNPTPSSPITSPQIPTPAHQAHNNQPPLNPPEAQTNIPQNQPTQNQNTETSSSSLPSTTVTQPPQNHHPMTTRRKNNIVKLKQKYHLSVSTTTSPFPEPQTVIQALKDKIWRDSMSQEMDGFCQEPDLPPCTALSIRM